ncbi:MAG: preprotein translocase subunit SecY [Verrucomicrobiae bacterium]|nr:preprotein translocase subunit SecY [Verrucomicrobiae bacterium]
MISAFTNAFKIPELRKRIFFTLVIVFISRLGAFIPVPGVDPAVLENLFRNMQEKEGGSFLALMNIFSGGALEHCGIFCLTVMPYISASIIFQLLVAVMPQLTKLSREEGGRQKITQYTRYLTIAIAIFQSAMFARTFENPRSLPMFQHLEGVLVPNPGLMFEFTTVVTLTGGTIFLMWLGEQITERGIGQGISMLIATNILARFPNAVGIAYQIFNPSVGESKYNIIHAALFLLMFLGVTASVIVVTQMQRKISVQYAQRMVGRKMYGGGQTYMPLRVNYSGVMPIIFAQALLMFPQTIGNFINVRWIQDFVRSLTEGEWVHLTFYSILIFAFSFFWVATVFNPIQIADDLKKHGGYVPGVRPGKPTADFLEYTMVRITFAGAVFLVFIAGIPLVLSRSMQLNYLVASFFGGTSLLIVVGVLLDTLRQIETHLLTRNYEGFLKKGRMRGRL